MAPTPSPNPRGLYCPDCKGHRLMVRSSSRPCPGVKVRYYVCSVCGTHLRGREVIVPFVGRAAGKSKPPAKRQPPREPRRRAA